MNFYIFIFLIISVVNIFLVHKINGNLPLQIGKIDRNPQPGGSQGGTSQQRDRNGYIFVQNDSKGIVHSTVSYTENNVRKAFGAQLKPGEFKKYKVPNKAKNLITNIEKIQSSSQPNTSNWSAFAPPRQVLLRDDKYTITKKRHKCYVISGPENNMKSAEIPCQKVVWQNPNKPTF